MAVQDLVELYESHRTQSSTNHQTNSKEGTNKSTLKPSPARFIKRAQRHDEVSVDVSRKAGISSTNTLHGDVLNADITGAAESNGETMPLVGGNVDVGSPPVIYDRALPAYGPAIGSNFETLKNPNQTFYPPNSDTTKVAFSHTPVAATVVFARTAPPLHLPRLDGYLSTLPTPSFSRGSENKETMFPPMDQLARTGLSLENLEANGSSAPLWRNRTTILSSSVNWLLGLMGSSVLASFYSLQGVSNTVQIFALILSTIVPHAGGNVGDKWRRLFLGTIPNVLALNFASTLLQSLFFLLIFMVIAFGLLYYFYVSACHCDRYNTIEGLQHAATKGKRWGLLIVTFLLTVIYLPLSTMAVHVLVWSEDLWVVPNPYVNATTSPPVLPPLGPANKFRDPLDFCWTTTMKRNEVNYAPVAIVLSATILSFLTIWFPIALRRVIRQSVPKVDKFTELGRPRSKVDMDSEYHRLLQRDNNPFAFLYSGFRRRWGTYESTYLFAKLSTLVIIAVLDPNNCFFRTGSRLTIPIVRQVLLLLSTLGFFIAQCIFAPFLDPVNNASEWISRLNYVATAATALAITLNVPGKNVINTYVLYSIYIITYGLSFYFSVIDLNITQRAVKRLTRRIDFSIDIFSPRLNTSPSSLHSTRRIWQEAIATLLLTTPSCAIPKDQAMCFAQAKGSEFPPYLLDFQGSPSERFVENLKILREVGSLAYSRAIALTTGPDYAWYRRLEDEIQKEYTGPDSYWKGGPAIPNCTSFFGNAWWIPFPPTLVIQYDDGPCAVLREASDLEAYIAQNSSPDIQRRRQVRMSLRALEGQTVHWPYERINSIGSQQFWCCWRKRYTASTSTSYRFCKLRIKRKGHLMWHGLHLGSGFRVELEYSERLQVSGTVIGLNDDFDLTSTLARFLELNMALIDQRHHRIETEMCNYRRYNRRACRWKSRVLTYQFLTNVYDKPQEADELARGAVKFECDARVCQLILRSEAAIAATYQRFGAVSKSEAATWWYIFWDDLWRRNHDTIKGLQRHATEFNPHYATSIAYNPLPRAKLESFLTQRGLLHKKPRWNDFFHSGFLNKLYLRLNDAVFRDSSRAIMFHLGDDMCEFDMEDIDLATQGRNSTLGTGGGTDHDLSWIRARPAYRWEGLLNDPPRSGTHNKQNWLGKLGAWFGITPLWRSGQPSNGIFIDVRLKNGRFVLIDNSVSSMGSH